MRLRLPRWLCRDPVPRGRHVRRLAPVTAPGAGAALVVGVAEPYLAAQDTTPELPAQTPPVEPGVVTASDVGTLTEPIPRVGTPAPTADADAAAPTPGERSEPAVAPEPTVALGFADGGVLELAADDPRLAGFQDAAAAVLARPQP